MNQRHKNAGCTRCVDHYPTANQLLAEPLHRPVLDGMKPQTSRRGFF